MRSNVEGHIGNRREVDARVVHIHPVFGQIAERDRPLRGVGVAPHLGNLRFRQIHIFVVNQVRSGKALAVQLAGPDIVRIRRAIQLDQRIGVGLLLQLQGRLELRQRILLGAQQPGDILGIVKGRNGIVQGSKGSLIDLSKVGATIHARHLVRVEVKDHSVFGDAQRGLTFFRTFQGLLETIGQSREFPQFRHRGSVHLLDSLVSGDRIHVRQDRVPDDPAQIGVLPHATGPVITAPEALRIFRPFGGLIGAPGVHTGGGEMLPTLD